MEQQFNLNPMVLQNSTGISCHECGGIFFTPAALLRKVSRIAAGAPTDIVVPLSVHICTSCNTPLKDEFESVLELFTKPEVETKIIGLNES